MAKTPSSPNKAVMVVLVVRLLLRELLVGIASRKAIGELCIIHRRVTVLGRVLKGFGRVRVGIVDRKERSSIFPLEVRDDQSVE